MVRKNLQNRRIGLSATKISKINTDRSTLGFDDDNADDEESSRTETKS